MYGLTKESVFIPYGAPEPAEKIQYLMDHPEKVKKGRAKKLTSVSKRITPGIALRMHMRAYLGNVPGTKFTD